MSEQLAGLRFVVGVALRSDRRKAFGSLLEPLGQLTVPLNALWLGLLVDGYLQSDSGKTWIAVLGVALCQTLNYLGQLVGAGHRLALSELVGHACDLEVSAAVAALPGIDHHYDPEFQERLILLSESQGALGQSVNAIINACNGVLGAIVVLAILAFGNPLLLLLVVFGLPTLLIAKRYQARLRDAESESARGLSVSRSIHDVFGDFSSAQELRIYSLGDRLSARHATTWATAQRPLLQAEGWRFRVAAMEQIIFGLGFMLAGLLMAHEVATGSTSPGGFMMIMLVGSQVQQRVIGPVYVVADLGSTLRAASRLLWLKKYSSRRGGSMSTKRVPVHDGRTVELEHASFAYPDGRMGVSNASVTLEPGSVVGIVGENGAGKSTLVNILSGLLTPTEGRLLIGGRTLATPLHAEEHRRLSAAFQDYATFELVLRESIALPSIEAAGDDERILRAMRRGRAESILREMPEGLDSQLGADWSNGIGLSKGQWQRVALARCFFREDASMLLLDEPTASLDPTAEHDLYRGFVDATARARDAGAVVLLVSHRFSTVRMADLILVIENGEISETGSHEQLMLAGGLYGRLYESQRRGYLD